MKNRSYITIIIMVMGLLSGCTGSITGAGNHMSKEENRISLAPENQEVHGIWSTGDLSLSYKYLVYKNTIKMNGKITLAGKITNFGVMEDLRLWVNFVDATGRIIDSKTVYTSPYRKWIPMLGLSFNGSLEVPEESAAIVFSYSGKVIDGIGSDNGGISWEFWKRP